MTKINSLLGAPVFVSLLFMLACEPAPSMMENKATPLPVTEPGEKLTSVEREIRDMETANFTVIFVFKRKDGGIFDKEDKKLLAAHKPADLNRLVSTDDEKAFVAGSNYPFPAKDLESLRKRFVVEDHSKPIARIDLNANSNVKTSKMR